MNLKHVRLPDDRREIGAGRILEKAGEGDFLRAVAEAVLESLMESDVEGKIGAGRDERSGERTTWRTATATAPSTPASARGVAHPKLRQGSYFPPFLEACKSSKKALTAVIQEACIDAFRPAGSTSWVEAMGLSAISKSQASKLCKEIDERVHAFLDWALCCERPYCGPT